MIHSDWHIHTDASYDARLPLETLIAAAKEKGMAGFGITDHLNYDTESFWGNIRQSAENYHRLKDQFPRMLLGVELTPVSQPMYDYTKKNGSKAGFRTQEQSAPFEIAMAGSKEALMALGVQYAIGACHWRCDVADEQLQDTVEAQIREWHRQQMWLAADHRVTILGHPWACNDTWFHDFSIVPASMHDELAAALLENGKYVECNGSMFVAEDTQEKFRRQYAEFFRYLFERGIPITYGSDCHGDHNNSNRYRDTREETWRYLQAAGFREGDITDLPDEALWQ